MSRLRELVVMKARKRLLRELCRALASGVEPHEVPELLAIAKAHQP